MILYIENPKDDTKKLLELINEFIKVAECKINIQKSVAFLYTKLSEREIKKTISFIIASKIIGLPWWRSGWESACQCRGRGFEPWSGRIPHAAERLGP